MTRLRSTNSERYLAISLIGSGNRDEGLTVLRERAARSNPSAEFLRTLARFLGRQPGGFGVEEIDPAEAEEAIQALRAALADRADPKRAMTLYNLSARLPHDDPDSERESELLLKEAMATSRFYARAWYARRTRGSHCWHRAVAGAHAGDHRTAQRGYRLAAGWYSAVIRSRPRFRVWFPDGRYRHILLRFPRSLILHANAEDAHRAAGHRLRAWRHHRIVERGRKRLAKRADRQLASSEFMRAYANDDFVAIGRNDLREVSARVLRAVALRQEGHVEAADRDFASTDERFPDLAPLVRAAVLIDPSLDLPLGLPGDLPVDEAGVRALLERTRLRST